jgi:hypothetical protein
MAEVENKGGRPPLFSTPEELEIACKEFIAQITAKNYKEVINELTKIAK